MNVLVTGGRGYKNRELAWSILSDVNESCEIDILIQGGAAGADRLAAMWAEENGIAIRTVQADWKRLGRAAGPIRNATMVSMLRSGVDLVVAFPGGSGTADCVNKATAAGVGVLRVE